MEESWHVELDGSYRLLTVFEGLLVDAQSALEDTRDLYRELCDAHGASRDIFRQSCDLVVRSQRERRLRATTLRLVRPPP